MLLEGFLNARLRELSGPLAGSVRAIEALRQLADLKTVVISSTDLLYDGPPRLSQYFGVEDQTLRTKQQVLQIAASVAAGSRLPIFSSFVQAAQEAGLPIREIETDAVGPAGITGKLDRTWYVLGDESAMLAERIELGTTSQVMMKKLELEGSQMYFLAQKQPKRLLGIFAVEPRLVTASIEEAHRLTEMGLELILLTVEKTRVAKGISQQLGISLVHSELSAESSAQLMLSLQGDSRVVATVIGREKLRYASRLHLPVFLSSAKGAEVPVRIQQFSDLSDLVIYSRELLEAARKKLFWCKIEPYE